MKLSKRLLSKTVAVAAVFATMELPHLLHHKAYLIPLKFKLQVKASRSVAPNYAILTLGITSENTNINAAKSNNDRIMSDLISKLGSTRLLTKRHLYI